MKLVVKQCYQTTGGKFQNKIKIKCDILSNFQTMCTSTLRQCDCILVNQGKSSTLGSGSGGANEKKMKLKVALLQFLGGFVISEFSHVHRHTMTKVVLRRRIRKWKSPRCCHSGSSRWETPMARKTLFLKSVGLDMRLWTAAASKLHYGGV